MVFYSDAWYYVLGSYTPVSVPHSLYNDHMNGHFNNEYQTNLVLGILIVNHLTNKQIPMI